MTEPTNQRIHIEFPMFSNKLLCGLRRGRLQYTWAINNEALAEVSCAACRREWRKIAKRIKK